MGKSQKRASKPEIGDTDRTEGSGNAAATSAHSENMEHGAGEEGRKAYVLPRDAAGYIQEMAIELKVVAESTRLSFLAYLLDLVIEESAMQKRGRL